MTTALVTGATRGFGHAIATELAATGVTVVGVGRDQLADGTEAHRLLDLHRPQILVLNAGATPPAEPIHRQTWETFSRNWDVDVRHVFTWLRESLLLPLAPGSVVITLSSGAALAGSPLSGGYAGAKATIRFITGYAAEESARAGLGIRFVSVLPKLTPATGLGASAVAAYAERQGVDLPTFLAGLGPTLTTAQVGKAITDLATDPAHEQGAYLLTPAGLAPAP
ncbi:SDR family NAD(P)-dependent oxidoreductase [Amycolatopsis jejuensis]|uniref:SDR family NAD(P)-dependent oxidoreductase n=1 Tax=Amycolatopsis jejuensis TaxID=330084 RepID=UPI0005275579|nr:SDR family oxidoreductase [Amycolatopsis jejuensis]